MEVDLENIEWKEFVLGNLFTIKRGKRLIASNRKNGNIPYYSAASTNNGLTDFIKNPLFIEKNKIIVTTFCDSYYVEGSFTASDEITMMSNKNLNKYCARFITRIITSNQKKYAYGRKAFSERLEKQIIILPSTPENKPDYAFMEQYMRTIEEEKTYQYYNYIKNRFKQIKDFKKTVPLDKKEWGSFKIEKIFKVKPGKRLTKANMKKGEKPFIGATDSNNGITQFVSNTNTSEDSNVLGVNYNGSVVENFYHPYKAIFSDDVKRLSFREVKGNKHLFMFVKCQILKQKKKYQYGYKFNGKRMNNQKILLPINYDQKPDYTYMENYIKQVEYTKLKQYIEFKEMKV